MSDVYVLIPFKNGEVEALAGELLTAARALGEPVAVAVGAPGAGSSAAAALAPYGITRLVVATAEDYDKRLVTPEVDALAALAGEQPGPIVVAAGAEGNEIGGRLAARLGSGFLGDCVALHPDGTAGLSILGDSYEGTAAVGGQCPVYAIRPGAVEPQRAARPGEPQTHTLDLPGPSEIDPTVENFTPAPPRLRPELSQAKVVVAGGRGVGDKEGFKKLVEPLADAFGGAVGATRDAVDEGFCDATCQIGQTGVTCAPELYIGVGISGAIQHKAGMQTSRTVVVINSDADAPQFDLADFGVVGDAHAIVPALLDEIHTRRPHA